VKSFVILGATIITRTQTGRVWRRTVEVRTAVVVPSQGEMHLNIDHSHPYTNKALTAKVMLDRADTTSLTCAQSPKPLSDARVDQKRTAGTGMKNPRATQKEIWCCPARHVDVVPPRSLSDTELKNCTRQHLEFLDCPKSTRSVQCSARFFGLGTKNLFPIFAQPP